MYPNSYKYIIPEFKTKKRIRQAKSQTPVDHECPQETRIVAMHVLCWVICNISSAS